MTGIDIDMLNKWIGRSNVSDDVIDISQARLMAATLDLDPASIRDGDELRPLWHWSYFLEGQRPGHLGRDGHPERGGFLPPVPLANRMWAGGRVRFHAPVRIGTSLQKRSTIKSINFKNGRSGPLVFVTVEHQLVEGDSLLVTELHDIVYKDPTPRTAITAEIDAIEADKSVDIHPTSTLLFRYSALTFNGHRVHYDVDYCRDIEGYPGLVVHGPLIATLLAGLALETAGRPLKTFVYRALNPAFVGGTVSLKATTSPSEVHLRAETLGKAINMTAIAEF